ncbi:hypothetical protein D3C74_390370 [compost metagenome]
MAEEMREIKIKKNVRIQFSFGEPDDEDTYDVDLQISWEASKATSEAIKESLDEAVQKWIAENVSFKWEEVEEEEEGLESSR